MLSPDGTLLIYDANWHAHLYDPELMKKVRVREEAHFRKYGTREIVTEDEETFLATCPITRTVCPGWEERMLTDLGMAVEIQREIGRFVYGDWKRNCTQNYLCLRSARDE